MFGHDSSPYTYPAGTHVSAALLLRSNTSYGLPCNTCTAILGILAMNVPFTTPHLVHSALCPIITFPHVGMVVTLLLVLVPATTLEMSWKNCVTLGLKQHRYLRTELVPCFSLCSLCFSRTHCIAYGLLSALFSSRSLITVP